MVAAENLLPVALRLHQAYHQGLRPKLHLGSRRIWLARGAFRMVSSLLALAALSQLDGQHSMVCLSADLTGATGVLAQLLHFYQ